VSGGRRLIELTDEFGAHHDHFACERCGALTDFDDEILELAISDASRRLGVQIVGHQLEMTGLCANCLAKQ
jgi:Fur family ferric uptake transcriptional regulator